MSVAAPPRRGLLDTSVVIDLHAIAPEHLPAEPAISALTLAELAAGPHAIDDPAERARRQDLLQRIESVVYPLAFDAGAARAYGRVFAATRAADGKPRGARAVDLMIASIALANDLALFTRNGEDFEHLVDTGLRLHHL